MFYPPEGLCSAEPERGPIVFTLDFIGVDYHTGIFKITTFRRPFWNPENVLSPGGTLRRAEPEGGPIVFTFHFIGVDYGTGIFKITTFTWLFWNLENVLSPGGTLRRAEPEGGPIVFTLDFIGVDYHTAFSKSPLLGGLFEILKMFCDTFLVSPPPLHTLNSFKVWNRYHILFLHLEGNHW